MKSIIIVLLLCCVTVAVAQELENNQTVEFELDGHSVTNELFIRIPHGATKLTIETFSQAENDDFDVFLKYDSPFTSNSINDILAESSYYSAGTGSDEKFTLSNASLTPLQAGNWYLSVLNFNAGSANIQVKASFNYDPPSIPVINFIFDQDTIANDPDAPCDIDGWFDQTPFTPVSGNNATTLGQARQNAAIKATELLTVSISSEVPLTIQGCWPELEATPTTAVLANARPRTLITNTPGSQQNTWHPVASAERLAGAQSCKLYATGCDDPAIIINYNKLIDTPQGLGSIRWYYGLNNSSTTSNPDFISTTMHEILHGLGFQSNIWLREDTEQLSCSQQLILHQTGSLLCNRSDIYTDKLAYHNNDQLTLLHEMSTNEQRITAITSEDKLVWNSIEVAASAANNLKSQGTGLVLLHAPDEIEPGSSVSHLHSSYTELMEPRQEASLRTLGLADPMLRELGWDPTSKTSAGVIPGLWHNPAMSGHGFSVEPIGRDDLYFVVFYSYDNNGLPEWYTSLVTLEDGVLNAEFSPTLVRTVYNYNNSTNPATATASNDPSVQGGISIDFNSFDASRSELCNDGVNRSDTNAIVRWKINDQESFWCIQPTINPSSYPKQDFGGIWWAGGEDSGWGISISLLQDVLVVGIYYYDSDGNPRWAIGQTDGFIAGEASSLTFRQVQGFGRDQPPGNNTTTNIGTATFTLSDNQGSLDTDGLMSIDIQFLGDNVRWNRDNIKIANFTQAH